MTGKRQSTQKTFQLSIEAGQKADQALLMYGTKARLAATLAMSRTTITNFFACRDVDQAKFKKICRELKLKWEEVIVRDLPADSGIDALVQQVRSQIEPTMRSLCGTMRVLDMDKEMDLDSIYINVKPLKPDKKRIDRRVLVEETAMLMMFGGPGVGKTIFLKRLAILCNQGEVLKTHIPIFISLQDWA